MNSPKVLREWAKQAGAPVPKHVRVDNLIDYGDGAYILWVVDIREGFEERVDYLEKLCAVARRSGKYARIVTQNKIGMTILVDLVGKFAEIDIEKVGTNHL